MVEARASLPHHATPFGVPIEQSVLHKLIAHSLMYASTALGVPATYPFASSTAAVLHLFACRSPCRALACPQTPVVQTVHVSFT